LLILEENKRQKLALAKKLSKKRKFQKRKTIREILGIHQDDISFSDHEITDKEIKKVSEKKKIKRKYKSKSPDKKISRQILQSSSSVNYEKNEKSESNANYKKLIDLKLRKMHTQSSFKTMRFDNSDNETQINQMNPNEAEFSKQIVKSKINRERSDILTRLCYELDSALNKSDTTEVKNLEQSKSLSK